MSTQRESAVRTLAPFIVISNGTPVTIRVRHHSDKVYVQLTDEVDFDGPTLAFDDLSAASAVVTALALALHDLEMQEPQEPGHFRSAETTVFKPLVLGVGGE